VSLHPPRRRQIKAALLAIKSAFPPSLAAPRNLTALDLSRNRLTGAIPALLFSGFVFPRAAESGVYLALSHNGLSGAIPRGSRVPRVKEPAHRRRLARAVRRGEARARRQPGAQ
jgi:hypothetical protein